MYFNSYIFILLFLPIFIIGYFITNKLNLTLGKLFVIVAGVIFYIYGGLNIAIIFGISILLNAVFAFILSKNKKLGKVSLLMIIVINVALLLFYKYFNFAITTFNGLFDKHYATRHIILPLGISFFTFQQIMYVASIYKGEIEKFNLLDYLSYILYFPKLIMGPLMEPKDFIEQLNDKNRKKVQWDNIAAGIKIFSYGLFKKMVIADTFSKAVAWGFENKGVATSGDLFLVMLFYTFEIYFDFSGYTDMAVGISNMVNITLPMNFNSPYKALSIKDFWKRWHMSLTGFLTKYIYFPLGGSKKGNIRTYVNIMIVFLVSGIWHGANWTFILWGCIHGLLQILERLFSKAYEKLSEIVKWFYTFFAVNILWLLFRAESITQWLGLLKKMFMFKSMEISDGLIDTFVLPESSFIFDIFKLNSLNEAVRGLSMLIFIVFAYIICLVPENNYKTYKKINFFNVFISAIAFVWAFMCLSSESVFVYFNF